MWQSSQNSRQWPLSINTQSTYNLNFIHCNSPVHDLRCTFISMFQLMYLPKFIIERYTKISDTSVMPFATPHSPVPPVKSFLCHHNLLCFLIPWMRLVSINIQQHIYTSPSAAATKYKQFLNSPNSMDVDHSIFSLVHLHIFCQFAIYVGSP